MLHHSYFPPKDAQEELLMHNIVDIYFEKVVEVYYVVPKKHIFLVKSELHSRESSKDKSVMHTKYVFGETVTIFLKEGRPTKAHVR